MKFFSMPLWKIILIIISGLVLTGGLTLGILFLTNKLEEEKVYPEEILFVYDETDQTSYNVTTDFEITITTNTDDVNQSKVTLSLVGEQDSKKGYITDGNIIVPKTVEIDKAFKVELVKNRYSGLDEDWVRGGISTLTATSENELIDAIRTTIAVDVPVSEISLQLFDSADTEFENAKTSITVGSTFVAKTIFNPLKSEFIYSNNNSKKEVFFESLSQNIVFDSETGIFKATQINLNSEKSTIKAYTFRTAKDRSTVLAKYSGMTGNEFYNAIITELKNNSSICVSTEIEISVVPVNISYFAVSLSSSITNPINITTNKIFTISGNSKTSRFDSSLGITIQGEEIEEGMSENLNSMIKHVGIVLYYFDTDVQKYVIATEDQLSILNSSQTIILENGDGRYVSYYLPDTLPSDPNAYNWEIVTSIPDLDIMMEVYLFEENLDGTFTLYTGDDDEVDFFDVYLYSVESQETAVRWNNTDDIELVLTYEENSNISPSSTSSFYDAEKDYMYIDENNLYQQKELFVTFKETEIPEDKTALLGYQGFNYDKYGIFNIGDDSYVFYHLSNDYLTVNKFMTGMELYFATIITTINGDPIYDEDGWYTIAQLSENFIRVVISETLDVAKIAGNSAYEIDTAKKFYIKEVGATNPYDITYIPTGSKNAVDLKITQLDLVELTTFENSIKNSGLDASKDKLRVMAYRDGNYYDFFDLNILADTENVTMSLKLSFNQSKYETYFPNYNMGGSDKGIIFSLYYEYYNTIETRYYRISENPDLAIYSAQPVQALYSYEDMENPLTPKNPIDVRIKSDAISIAFSESETPIDNISELNNRIKVVLLDQFEREVDPNDGFYDYILETNNTNAISINRLEKTISFYAVNGVTSTLQGYVVDRNNNRVKAVDANGNYIDGVNLVTTKLTFYIESDGVSRVTYDTSADVGVIDENNFAVCEDINEGIVVNKNGLATNEHSIKLKDIIRVYTGEYTDESAPIETLKFKFSASYYSKLSETSKGELFTAENSIFTLKNDLEEIEGENLTADTNITEISLRYNAGVDITLEFTVYDESGIVDLSLILVINKTATFNNLFASYASTADYRANVVNQVNEKTGDIVYLGVYAQDELDIKTFLPISILGQENPTMDAGKIKIEGESFTCTNGILKFDDVFENTPRTIKVYFETVSSYAAYTSITFNVNPNFVIKECEEKLGKNIDILTDDLDFEKHYNIVRVDNSGVKDINIQFENISNTKYFRINNTPINIGIERLQPINLSIGEYIVQTFKMTYSVFGVPLDVRDNLGNLVTFDLLVTADFSITDFINTAFIYESGKMSNLSSEVNYDGGSRLYLIENGFYYYKNDVTFKGTEYRFDYDTAGNNYVKQFTQEFRVVSIKEQFLNITDAISVTITNTQASNIALAKIRMPIMISGFGDKFAQYTNDDYTIIQMLNTLQDESVYEEVNANNTYKLVYDLSNEEDVNILENNGFGLVYTSLVPNGNGVRYLEMKNIEIHEVYRIVDGKKVALSSTLARIEDENIIFSHLNKDFEAYVVVKVTIKGANSQNRDRSQTVYYRYKVMGDIDIDEVIYPYYDYDTENTDTKAEYIDIRLDQTVNINLEETFDITNSNANVNESNPSYEGFKKQDKTRFFVYGDNSTVQYKAVSLTVNGVDSNISSYFEISFENGIMSIKRIGSPIVENSKMILVIEKSYTDIVGSEQLYTFYINSGKIYILDYKRDGESLIPTKDELSINTYTKQEFRLTFELKEQSIGGSADTTVTENILGFSFTDPTNTTAQSIYLNKPTLEFNTNNNIYTLSFKLDKFMGEDFVTYLYIYTSQGLIQTIKVNIESNVAVKMNKNDNIFGGAEVTAESLIQSLNYNGKSIDTYETYDKTIVFEEVLEGNEYLKLSDTSTAINVAQLKDNITIRTKIYITIMDTVEGIDIGIYSFEYSFVVKANLIYNDTDKTIVQSNVDYAASVIISDKNVYYAGEVIKIDNISNSLNILSTLNNSNTIIRSDDLDTFNSVDISYSSEYITSANVEGNTQLATINTKSILTLESVKVLVLIKIEYRFKNDLAEDYIYNFYLNYEFTIYKNVNLLQNYPDPDNTGNINAEYITVKTVDTNKVSKEYENFFVTKADLAPSDNFVITPVTAGNVKYTKLSNGTQVTTGETIGQFTKISHINTKIIDTIQTMGTDNSFYVLRDNISSGVIIKESFIYTKTSSRILVDSYFDINKFEGSLTEGEERISNTSVYSVAVKELNNIKFDVSYINEFNEEISLESWNSVGIIRTEIGKDTLDYYGFSSFTFKFYKLSDQAGKSYVTFAVTINGVTIDYTVYLDENVYSLKNVYIRENSDLLIKGEGGNADTPVTGEDIYVEDLVEDNSEYILSQNRILTYQFNPAATRTGIAFIRYLVNGSEVYNKQINVNGSALENPTEIREDIGLKGCEYLGTYDSTSMNANLIPDSAIYLAGKAPKFVSRVNFLYNGVVIADNKLEELDINYYSTNEHYVAFSEDRKVKLSAPYTGMTDAQGYMYEFKKDVKVYVDPDSDNDGYVKITGVDNGSVATFAEYKDSTVKLEGTNNEFATTEFYVRVDDLKTESGAKKINKDNVKIFYKTNGYSNLNHFFVASTDFSNSNYANEVRFIVNNNVINALYAYRICIDFEVKEQTELYTSQEGYAANAVAKAKQVTVSNISSLVNLFKVKHVLNDNLISIDDFDESSNATLNAQFFGLDISILNSVSEEDSYLKGYSESAYKIDEYLKSNNFKTGLHPVYMTESGSDDNTYGYKSNGLVTYNSIEYNYLTLRQKQVSTTNEKAYDYDLVAQGASNDGNYVMLLLDYRVNFGNEELHKYSMLLIKVMPDYVVTVEGQATESLNDLDSDSKNKTVRTNRNNPITREISSADGINYAYDIAVFGHPNTNVLSISHVNSSSENVAKEMYYTYRDGYSATLNNNTAKLFTSPDMSASSTISSLQDTRWTSTGRTALTIYGKKCVFGNKNYVIHIIDKYGYKIELYFTLKAEQSPYVAYSGYNFIEGKSYVLGSEYYALTTAYNTSNTTTGSGLSVVTSEQKESVVRGTSDYITDIGIEPEKTFKDSIIIGGINAYGYAERPKTFRSIVEILNYFESTTNPSYASQDIKKNKETGIKLLKSIALPISVTTTSQTADLKDLAGLIKDSLQNQIIALNKQTEFQAYVTSAAAADGSYTVKICKRSDETSTFMTIKVFYKDSTYYYGDIEINFTNTLGLLAPDGTDAIRTFNTDPNNRDIDKNISLSKDTEAANLVTEYLQPFSIVSNNYNQYISPSSIENITLESVEFLATDGVTTIGVAEKIDVPGNNPKLATNSTLVNFNDGGDFDSYKHKGADNSKKAAAFTVGYLDSYVYGEGHESGSGKSVVTNAVITLKYSNGSDIETATIVLNNATVSREYPEKLNVKEVHDGSSVSIQNVINSTDSSLSSSEFNVYNDTLEVVLDPGVNIKFNVTASSSDNSYPNYSSTALKATVTKNAIYNYKARYYVGISNSLNRAIDTTYSIILSDVESTGNYEIRYNGTVLLSNSVTTMTPFTVTKITEEKFNIENSAQWEGGDSIIKTKYYLINPTIKNHPDSDVKGKYFYRYRVDYNVKRAYDVTSVSSIVVKDYYKTNNGYVIPIKDWALGDTNKIALTSYGNTRAMSFDDVYKFNYVINTSHAGGSSSAGAAFVDENGTLYTTSGFNITYHEIILDMYIKASGFNGNFEVANMDRDKKVGTIRIVLENNDDALTNAITTDTPENKDNAGLYKLSGLDIFIGINNISEDEKGYIYKTNNATAISKVTIPATNKKEFYLSMDSGRKENAELTYDMLKNLIGVNSDSAFTNYHIYNINGAYYNSSNLNSWTFTSTGTYVLKVINQSAANRSKISYHEITVYVYDVADIEESSYAIDYTGNAPGGDGKISINLTNLLGISTDYILSEEEVTAGNSSFKVLTDSSVSFVRNDINKIVSKRILATNKVTGSIKTYLLTFYVYDKNTTTTTYKEVKFAVAGENSFEIRSLKGLVDRTGEPTFYAVDSASGKMSTLSADYITTLKSDNDTVKTTIKYLMVYNTTATTNNIMFIDVIPYVYSNVFTGNLPVIHHVTGNYTMTGIADAIKRNIINNSSLGISEITEIKVHRMHSTINNVFEDGIIDTQEFKREEKNKKVAYKYFVEYTFDGKTKFASFNFNYYVATEEKASYNYVSEVTNAASLVSIFKKNFNNPSTAPKFYEIINGEVSNEETTNIQLTNANNFVDKKYLVYHIKDGAEKYSVASVKVYIYSNMITENIQANVYDGISMSKLNGLTLNADAEKTYYMIDDENNMILITNYTKLIDSQRAGRDLVIVSTTEDGTEIKRYSEFNINVYDKKEIDIAVYENQVSYDLSNLFGTDAKIYSIVNNGVNFSRENILQNTIVTVQGLDGTYYLVEKNGSIYMYHINVYKFENTVEFIQKEFTFDLYENIEITDIVTDDLLGEVDPAATVDYFVLSDVELDEGIEITAESISEFRFNSYDTVSCVRGEYVVGNIFYIVVRITTPVDEDDPSVVYKIIQVKLIPPVEITCDNTQIPLEADGGMVVKIPTIIGPSGCMDITYNIESDELNGDILFVYNNTEFTLDDNLPIETPGAYSFKIIYKLDSSNVYEIGNYVIETYQ